MKSLNKLLQEKGIKPTYQRLKILEYIQKHMKTHPTAEMIYEALRKDIPTISITTVYNTLKLLSEKGLVDAVFITGTEIRFDFNTEPHHHFLCKKCGRILDISIRCPFAEGKEIDKHQVQEVHGYFKGICQSCNRRLSINSTLGIK